jgi:predicted transcriptional regulator
MNNDDSSREAIFQYIVKFKREHDGLSPSVPEIAAACLIGEPTVRYHLLKLEAAGRIISEGRRGLQVRGGAWDFDEV